MANTELSCREIVELVTDYLEGVLPPAEQEAFERHLRKCDGCLAYLDQLRDTILLTSELREESIPAALQDELVAVFRGWSERRL